MRTRASLPDAVIEEAKSMLDGSPPPGERKKLKGILAFAGDRDKTASQIASEVGISRTLLCDIVSRLASEPLGEVLKRRHGGGACKVIPSGVLATLREKLAANTWNCAKDIKDWLAQQSVSLALPTVYGVCANLGFPIRSLHPKASRTRYVSNQRAKDPCLQLPAEALCDVELEYAASSSGSTRHQRLKAVFLASTTPMSKRKIAAAVGCSLPTLREWFARFLIGGVEELCQDKERGRTTPIKDAGVLAALKEFLTEQTRTAPEAAHFLRERFGIQREPNSMYMWLGKYGRKQTRPARTCNNKWKPTRKRKSSSTV